MTGYFDKASQLVAEHCKSEGSATAKFIVWYAKNSSFTETDYPKTKMELMKTHVRLAQVKATNCDEVYEFMQGENWSPLGQANPVIRGLGLSHTSMSVGDIIQVPYLKKFFLVCNVGYKELNLQ